jgi:hypothetical protein
MIECVGKSKIKPATDNPLYPARDSSGWLLTTKVAKFLSNLGPIQVTRGYPDHQFDFDIASIRISAFLHLKSCQFILCRTNGVIQKNFQPKFDKCDRLILKNDSQTIVCGRALIFLIPLPNLNPIAINF